MNGISKTIYMHIQELDKEIKTIIIPDEGFSFFFVKTFPQSTIN